MSHEYISQHSNCPVCNGTDITVCIEMHRVPVHCNLIWSSRKQAIQAPRGDIRLGLCRTCGHIFNLNFKAELMEYTQAYENALDFSPRFQNYAESLVAYLIDRFNLHGKDIIEIGCGKGDFLKLLCKLGNNHGVGFDPSYLSEQGKTETNKEPTTFIQDFYSKRYADYKADFICCRHVLEHLPSPKELLIDIRYSIGNRSNTALFFEVPNVSYILRDLGIWDIIYEHFSYFSSISLASLFILSGFDVNNVSEMYDGQFLSIEAFPHERPISSIHNSKKDLEYLFFETKVFAKKYKNKIDLWKQNIEGWTQLGKRVVVWGGGSKGVTFLNTLHIQDHIKYVVDINPRKQGKYIAGTGQEIVAPEFLHNYRPDVIIVMNPIYQGEIQQITRKVGLTIDIICA